MNMELKRGLKELSPKFVIGKRDDEFSLWFGRNDRLLVWRRGELTASELLHLAQDFLKRHPKLAKTRK